MLSHITTIINTILIVFFGIMPFVFLILWLRQLSKYNKIKNHDNKVDQVELDQRLKWIGK